MICFRDRVRILVEVLTEWDVEGPERGCKLHELCGAINRITKQQVDEAQVLSVLDRGGWAEDDGSITCFMLKVVPLEKDIAIRRFMHMFVGSGTWAEDDSVYYETLYSVFPTLKVSKEEFQNLLDKHREEWY